MRAALYQMHIVWNDEDRNYAKVRHQLARAASDGVDVFLMPETCYDGFFAGNSLEDCRIVQENLRLAEHYGLAIGFGWVRRDALPVPPSERRKYENHYTIVGKDGNVLSDYTKLHLFQGARKGQAFRPGDHMALCQICGIPTGTFICYDLWFPELISKLSEQAHLVLLPANWEETEYQYSHWKTLLQARAMENQQYILAVNCVGRNGRFHYGGCSAAVNPLGEFLPVAAGDREILMTDREGLLIYDFEDDVEKYRHSFPVAANRLPALYPDLPVRPL